MGRGVGRGLTLLELMTVLGMVTLFLGFAYRPLELMILYPRRSQIAFSDRAAVVTAERLLLDNLNMTEREYLWVVGSSGGLSILMGQAREYREPKESPITHYTLFHYDSARSIIERWELPPDLVHQKLGAPPRPGQSLSEAKLQPLLEVREGKSLVATHVTKFAFVPGPPDQPCLMEIAVSTPNFDKPADQRSGPTKSIRRSVGVVE